MKIFTDIKSNFPNFFILLFSVIFNNAVSCLNYIASVIGELVSM